ncbi:uncharacterized protein N7515_001200 [Penicillium bovifimosum]|uniref:Uncharacterized protein n=1 Tax=Penicillium bovifimosum TaxID=126998 RepID=A0A9W9LC58_9EURO|nr:uncharacterized protein N7515_001200 [Penicillium bovifimosum]KAJ5146636.1 hypothetical protein N7515_001200 [Penicillium bovifimosum]
MISQIPLRQLRTVINFWIKKDEGYKEVDRVAHILQRRTILDFGDFIRRDLLPTQKFHRPFRIWFNATFVNEDSFMQGPTVRYYRILST